MARQGRAFPSRRAYINSDLGPVYFDNASISAYGLGTTIVWTILVGTNTNRLLEVNVGIFAAGTVSSIDVSGQAMTKLRSDVNGVYTSEKWYLVNPTSGTRTVTVTLSASLTAIAGAIAWRNVDQTNPYSANTGANGTNTPASAAVTPTSANNRVSGGLATQTATAITDQIRQAPHHSAAGALGSLVGSEMGTIVVAASTTLSWSGMGALDSWAVSLGAIQPPQPVSFIPRLMVV